MMCESMHQVWISLEDSTALLRDNKNEYGQRGLLACNEQELLVFSGQGHI